MVKRMKETTETNLTKATSTAARGPVRRQAAALRAPRKKASAASRTAAQPSHEEIARLAYEIYLRRNGQGGSELEDWTEAERQLRG